MTINERLKNALKECNISQGAIALDINVREATVSENLNKQKESTSILILKSILKFTGYNSVWIIEGKGEKYKNIDLIKRIEDLEKDNAWLRGLLDKLPPAKG